MIKVQIELQSMQQKRLKSIMLSGKFDLVLGTAQWR